MVVRAVGRQALVGPLDTAMLLGKRLLQAIQGHGVR